MKRTFGLVNSLAAVTFLAMGLTPAASAGYIFLNDNIDVAQYALTPGTPVDFGNSLPSITGLATTRSDTNISSPFAILAATQGSNSGIYAYAQSCSSPCLFASVATPVGLTVDGAGNVYVAANGGTTIEELSPTGAFIKDVATTGVTVQSLVADGAGDVFVADSNTGTIIEYLAGGGSTTYSSASLDGFANPGITIDHSGDLFVTYASVCGTSTCGGVDEVTPDGTVSDFYSTTAPPDGVAADVVPIGIVYDGETDSLFMSYLDSTNGPGGGIEQFVDEASTPTSFATDSSGRPGAIALLTPEPGSILLFGGGLLLTSLLHFRRVRRLAQADRDRA